MGVLITDCITSGVKLARHQQGLLYGTREVAIVEMSIRTIEDIRMTSDSGDGLSCSSKEVAERQWNEGLQLRKEKYFRDEEIRKAELQLDLNELKIIGAGQ